MGPPPRLPVPPDQQHVRGLFADAHLRHGTPSLGNLPPVYPPRPKDPDPATHARRQGVLRHLTEIEQHPEGLSPCGLLRRTTMAAVLEAKLLIDGRWVDGGPPVEVRNKYSGEVIGTLPAARREDVDAAVAAAARAVAVMAEMPAHRRSEILSRTAALIRERRDEFARTIAAEAGKALKYARAEVDRGIMTFTIAAEEARRLHGETVPLDAVPAGEGYFGFWIRRPVGVVAAISPFNFPLNLVAHKVAPALAAGNTVVLKPATATPLTAVNLCQVLAEAGLPGGAINLIVGPGGTAGEWLVTHPPVAKVP